MVGHGEEKGEIVFRSDSWKQDEKVNCKDERESSYNSAEQVYGG